jgi:O-antigen ligase
VTRAEKVLLALLVVLVLFTPVFLGGVRGFEKEGGGAPTAFERFLWAEGPWWIQMALAGAIAVASLAVAKERRNAGEPEAWRLHPGLLLPFAGVVLLAVLQYVPLPRGLLDLLSPQEGRQLDVLLPGDRSWRPLTLSPEGTLRALGGLALGGSVLLGSLLAARRKTGAVVLLGAVVAAFAGSAVYGLWTTLLGGDTVLGFQKGHGKGVTGTFLNRSNFAAAAGLAIPLALGLAWLAVRRGRRMASAGLLASVAALAVAVPLSNSRMGILAAAAGLVALGALAARALQTPRWVRGLVVVGALGLAAGGAWVAVDRVPALRERFALGRTADGYVDVRFPAWRSTLVLASRYPVLGTGTGAYETAIHETQTSENPDELVHAHCEPLEVLAEGGILGLALAVLLAAGAVAGVVRAVASGDAMIRALGCAAGGALAVVLVGSLTEFHLRVPALGIAAAVLAAVPAALAAGAPRAPGTGLSAKDRLGYSCMAFIAVGMALLPGPKHAALRGAVVRAEMAGDAERTREAADPAATLVGDAASWRALAKANAELVRGPLALQQADRAVDLEPFNAYGHWTRAVAILAGEGNADEAAKAIDRALSRAGGIGHLHLAAGSVLLHLSLQDPRFRAPALAALLEAGECHPHHYPAARALLERLGLDPALRAAFVPGRWFPLERELENARKAGDAAYERALLRRLRAAEPGE